MRSVKQIVINRSDVVTNLQERITSIGEAVGFYNDNGMFVRDVDNKLRTKAKHYNAGRLEELMADMETYDVMISKSHFNLYNKLVTLLK